MDSAIHNSENEQAAQPQLVIRRPDGGEFVHELTAASGAIAGSDRTCSLHLDGEGVAGLHCMIRFEDGRIYVKDWYSEAGTFVNDQRIDVETVLPDGGVVRVGGFTMTVQFASATAVVANSPNDAEQAELTTTLDPTGSTEDVEASENEEPASACEETPDWFDEAETDESQSESQFDFGSDDSHTGIDPETFALLQDEVEHLQNELAQRDAKLEELKALSQADDGSAPAIANSDPSETAALVDRLEQLLDELTQSDHRMATMEELLQLAEEANVADREERRQIDEWVGDIECRIGEREAEWTAELEVLRERVVESTDERDRAERRVGKAGASKEQQAEFQRILEQARGKADALRAKLEETQAEKAEFESRLQHLNGERAEEILQQRIDEAMREERLAHAQEQATMARERAELSRVKLELERAREVKLDEQSEIDGKFRAFRDHLKELHQQESEQKKERGLSARLSNLWKRLEGRSS